MSGYVATKKLKEIPKKTWFDELDDKEMRDHCAATELSESAILRKAFKYMSARIKTEGYKVLFEI